MFCHVVNGLPQPVNAEVMGRVRWKSKSLVSVS